MPSLATVLLAGFECRCAIASSSTERTTSSLRSVMSFATPDVENAAGIVSRLIQAPFAKLKKSWHAFAELSMNDGSNTLSVGGIGTAGSAEAVLWAPTTGAKINERQTPHVRNFGIIM